MKHIKKRWLLLELILLITFVWFIIWTLLYTGNPLFQRYDQYCAPINDLVKDEDFFSGGIGDGQIVLCDKDYDVIKVIPFDGYKKSFHIRQIFRDGIEGVVFFEMDRAVDDSYGIVYINDPPKNKLLEKFDLMDQYGYHKIGTPKQDRCGIFNGPHTWMQDVAYLKRIGTNSYQYSTMAPR